MSENLPVTDTETIVSIGELNSMAYISEHYPNTSELMRALEGIRLVICEKQHERPSSSFYPKFRNCPYRLANAACAHSMEDLSLVWLLPGVNALALKRGLITEQDFISFRTVLLEAEQGLTDLDQLAMASSPADSISIIRQGERVLGENVLRVRDQLVSVFQYRATT